MGWVSICVFVNCCKSCFNVCGVWTLGLSDDWLCTQMIDVRVCSSYW